MKMDEIIEQPVDFTALSRYMAIEAIQGNKIRGRIYEPVQENIQELKRVFARSGAIAFFEREGEGHLISYGYLPASRPVRLWINILLLAATVVTTLIVGTLHAGKNPFASLWNLISGIPFSLGIILILGSHELAHYLTARHYGVDATPPYFLPVPHPMTGTMGAFIRIRSPVPSRSALVRVGVAGPLVGFLVAIPVSVIGLALSTVKPVPAGAQLLRLGSPLIFELISRLFHRVVPAGFDVVLHPLAFAGWLGMFVTALNLLPVGQLDGGHIAYALLGQRYRLFTILMIVVLLLLGFFWLGWPFWAFLSTVLGLKHPPPLDNITPLDRTDIILAVLALVIFILSFTPVPFPGAGF
ncbi:MAG: site-2 protease family protein [candidate division WOR-3 bacterium]|jgi:membrane-associated protease RseP (regulator of RpoE activity)